MASTSDQLVPRLFMFQHKVCLPVVRTYFNNVILSDRKYNGNFKNFLEYHKHEMYHLYFNERCCKCNTGKVINNKQRHFRKQFDKVYTLGSPNRSHLLYRNGKVFEHCCCGLVSNKNCSTKELDMTALYAILKTCVPNMDPSHVVWLDKIVEQRNKLSHLSDTMTENEAQVMWNYLDSSTLALASNIPPIPLYGENIETQVEFLKAGNYSADSVRSIVEAIKLEMAEQNNNISRTRQREMSDMQTGLQEYIGHKFCELENSTVASKNELKGTFHQVTSILENATCEQAAKLTSEIRETVENKSNEILEAAEKTKCEIMSGIKELKGVVSHESKGVNFSVQYSRESLLGMLKACCSTADEVKKTAIESNDQENNQTACFSAAHEVQETATESNDQENNQTENSDVFIYWKINTKKYTTEEKTTIKERLIKAANSIDCWFPYKITHVFDGSVVIGTVLPKDTFESKELFENSIRKFLDMIVEVTGISTNVPECIEVEMLISKTPFTVSPFYCRYEIERSFTKDASVQAAQSMSDKMTTAEQFAKDGLCYHKITRKRTSFPSGCDSSDQFAIICWRNISSPIVETIKLSVQNDPNVRSCFTFETIDIGYFLRKDSRNFRTLICVNIDGSEDMFVSSTHLPTDAETHIVIDVLRFFKEDNYKSSIIDRTLEELTNALGPSCYYACYVDRNYRFGIDNKWTVCFSSSLSTNSKIISIIDMLSNFLKSKHTLLHVSLVEMRDAKPDVPYILPISHAKCDITRNVKPEYIISMQLDSTNPPMSISNVDCLDARNLQDGKWLQQLEKILGTRYWITRIGNVYNTLCCGEYSDFGLVRTKLDGLSSLSLADLFGRFGPSQLIVFLFKKTEQETSSALIRYINECKKETIIVLFDHAEIPDQLRDYRTIHASEDDSTTYEEILKARKDAGGSKSPFRDDVPGSSPICLGEKPKFKEDSVEMIDEHLKKTKDMNTTKIKQAINKTDPKKDTCEVQ